MLVPSGKYGQKFRIDGEVTITLVKVDRNSIRIGIEAPSDVPICREELSELDRRPRLAARVA